MCLSTPPSWPEENKNKIYCYSTMEGVLVPSLSTQQFPNEAWSTQPVTDDWSAAPTAQATEWVETTTKWS